MDPVEPDRPDSPSTVDSTVYPTAFETDVVLADGATTQVRPIRPEDAARLTAFHARQSPQSIYYRFFSARPRLSDRDLERFTNVDYVDRFALVALRAGEIIGVARYDRWRHRSDAEVAFFVDDANHGRGLATVLLEHLAARAREVGLTAFTASVLPENRRMIGVFTQAGFETTTSFADGVVEVRLGLRPTPEAQAAIDERARAAASEAVRRLLSPRSVAVIGASREEGSIGHDVLVNLQRAHFNGPVWAVNPRADQVAGLPAVASILDIDEDIDLAVVVVPADAVAAVLEECGRKEVYGAVILSAGFAEAGPEGAARQDEVVRAARAWGVRLVGPTCLGIVNADPDVRLRATFAPVAPRSGCVGLLAESGMVGAAILGQATEVGLGISSFVALGNRADVSSNDLLQYWEGDPATEVVCLYLESFGNPRHFSRLARRLARQKPVVALKAGRLAASSDDPFGPDVTEDALLRQTGVIRVPSVPALLDTARFLCSQPLPRGRRVAVLGNPGGSLLIAVDAVLEAGLAMAEVREGTVATLAGLGRRETGPVALVDLGLTATGHTLEQAATALAGDPGVDAVLAVYAPSLGASGVEARAALGAAQQAQPEVPIVACFYGVHPPETGTVAVPVYDAVDAAALALGRAADYAEWLALPEGEAMTLPVTSCAAVRAVVDEQMATGAMRLAEPAALAMLGAAGLTVLATAAVDSVEAAVAAATDMGFPVVLKAAGRLSTAKTAAAGFAVDLEDEEAVRAAWGRMNSAPGLGPQPALVQPMVGPGVDVAVIVRDHPTVGPVLSLGPGGAAAALDTAVDVRVLPLTGLDAARLVAGSRVGRLLDTVGGQALEQLLLQVAALLEAVHEVGDLELNPVIIRDGEAVVTNARATVRALPVDPRPELRRI